MNPARTIPRRLSYLLVILAAVIVVLGVHCVASADHDGALSPLDQFYRHVRLTHPPATPVVHRQFNFHVVAPGVWRSSQPNEEALRTMKEHGLKTIINLRRGKSVHRWEEALAKELSLRYYRFPMDARDKQDEERLREILEIMHDPANQPVLVHCHAGKDRTGLMAALYKLTYLGASVDDVHHEMVMYGYDKSAFPEISRTVKSWDGAED